MGVLRRLAQGLGLVYRDDGNWRPTGMRTPPSAPKSQSTNPPAEPIDLLKGAKRPVSNWMERRPTWQFALMWGALIALAIIVGGAAAQWLWHGRLNFSYFLGSAVGVLLVAPIAALGYRASRSQDH